MDGSVLAVRVFSAPRVKILRFAQNDGAAHLCEVFLICEAAVAAFFQKIDLVEMLFFTGLHEVELEIFEVIAGYVVLVACFGIAGALHVVLAFYVFFADAVEDDMDVDIAGVGFSVFVSADYGLMAGEVLFCVFHTEGLGLLYG